MSTVTVDVRRSTTLANVQLNFLALYCKSRPILCPPKLEVKNIDAITKDFPKLGRLRRKWSWIRSEAKDSSFGPIACLWFAKLYDVHT